MVGGWLASCRRFIVTQKMIYLLVDPFPSSHLLIYSHMLLLLLPNYFRIKSGGALWVISCIFMLQSVCACHNIISMR